MLTAHQVSKSYSSGKVLDNISLKLEPGSIHGLLGPNGAGKSTLFKILCGLVTPDSGEVNLHTEKRKAIGAIIEQPGLYTYLSSWDNLKLFAQIQQASYDTETIKNALLRVGLPPQRKDPVRNFSMGMKQRLGIAIALLNKPEILILDEPFSGLDPIGVASLIKLIKGFAKQGFAILLSSHLLTELYKSCDYLYVINKGKIIEEGTTQDLISKFVSTYTISGTGVEHSTLAQSYVIATGINEVTVQCDRDVISSLLKHLLNEDYQVTSCVPNVSMEQFIGPQP